MEDALEQGKTELPRYRNRRAVWAARIEGVRDAPDGAHDLILSHADAMRVPAGWFDAAVVLNNGQSVVGGYLIVDPAGFKTFCPWPSFEGCYKRLNDTGRHVVEGDVGFAGDAIEYAWGVIANAFDGNWTKASEEWQTAAARFRDEFWHPWLDAHGYTTRSKPPQESSVWDNTVSGDSHAGIAHTQEPDESTRPKPLTMEVLGSSGLGSLIALKEKLRAAVNSCSAEGFAGDTPDFVVAELLLDVIGVFGKAVQSRRAFFATSASDTAAAALWRLLDDIDTLDDACKGDNEWFRREVRAIQQKRHSILHGAVATESVVLDDARRESRTKRHSECNRIIRILKDEGVDEHILERVLNEHDSAAAPSEG